MNLQDKALGVRQVFDELGMEIKSYLDESQLTCFSGCGLCCSNPKVNASVIEFLPLAFKLFEEGKAESVLEKLETLDDDACVLYKKTSEDGHAGFCSDYQNRGLICRLFGTSSRKNKYNENELLVCNKIKVGKPELFNEVSLAIKKDMQVPSSANNYSKLSNLDFDLTSAQFTVNIAIKNALEAVLRFEFYERNQEPEIPVNF
ncbi:YkgJ family cysteine cluster protein [Rhodonellum sp.]|uniref:YkgJ family cysteine cluster protein n=1 Tax=Rhodonellum sp. TaxID=2231180 RepID=UPI002722DEEB|nr:YkgJ family cysteine cluster protein [Rhodonellum sp.]MDO9552597.1 YkgJ family cysteine cluster protein [Rhodonellum sp.]